MSSPKSSHIVADGRWRILNGSARVEAARLQARLMRRAAPLLCRAGFVGRLLIRRRISRFVRRHVAKRAPFEALYSTSDLRVTPAQHPQPDASRAAMRSI